MKWAALIVLALAACAMPVAAPPPPAAPEQSIIIAPARPETRERSLSSRDRELIEAAKRALERVRKRLDWLNGTEAKPMAPSSH